MLGLPWDTKKDVIHLSMDVNLSPKKQGVRTEESLEPGDEDNIKDAVLTRRQLMSQIHSIYEPFGLLSPITTKFKLVLQEMVQTEMGWDKSLEGELKKQAEQLSPEMATVKPDIAKELKNDHDAMKSFFREMFQEIMGRVGVLEEREAEADRPQLVKELIGDEYFDPEPRYSGTVAKFMSRMKCMIRNPEKQDGEPPKNEVAESDGGLEAPDDVSPEVTKKEEGEPPENEVAQLERDSLDVPEKQEVEPHGEEVREPDDVGPDVPDKQVSKPPENEVAFHDVGIAA